jgi:hypothetical protein
VGQDNAELIVQAMEQGLKIEASGRIGGADEIVRRVHACPDAALESDSSVRAGGAASRHNVSAKIRIEPPAVRTYSTLPAEIQL